MAIQQLIRFEGHCPRVVSRDAKYSVKLHHGHYVVGLIYKSQDGERWYPVNADHSNLVEMVNSIKEQAVGKLGGSFYINEYQQVIVPTVNGPEYYLAGEYHHLLEFDFEGHVLSGNAVDLRGNPLSPGDTWVGPHPGIPYVLTADGNDIYYDRKERPDVTRQVKLSQHQDRTIVARLCSMLRGVKGLNGGRFYINEFHHLFAPVNAEGALTYIYVGHLESLRNWFPKPHVTTSR